MNLRNPFPPLLATATLLLSSALALQAADDAASLTKRGTLIFHDTFEREEDGNLAKAIGNGWNSATADRVTHLK
ncbi:MAG: hypothetical protein KGR69_04770, partial [Verrucomicrobia bacterium]|nr:hypothetical protein [Verrucomicrobiota bacterium]